MKNLRVEVAEGFERRQAAFAGQDGHVGEGEGELLFDFEEGHGWRDGGGDGGLAGGKCEMGWGEYFVMVVGENWDCLCC